MPEPRRIARKLETHRHETFDEHLWPINVALVMLGAVLAGFCISVFEIGDPEIHRNAITWLAAIPVIIGLCMWGLRFVSNRLVRRAVLLSVVLSLILNVGLMIIMAVTTIFGAKWKDQQQVVVEPEPDPVETIRDYVVHPFEPTELPKRDFEKPVEAGVLEAALQQTARQEATPDEPTMNPAEPAEQPGLIARAHVRPRRREMESAPHHSPRESQLSRQLDADSPQLAQTTVAPAQEPPLQAEPARIEAPTTSVQRQAAEVALRQTTVDLEPSTLRTAPSTQLARRQPQTKLELQASATPTLQRRMNRPSSVPRTNVATIQLPGAARQTDLEALQPHNTLTLKNVTAASPSISSSATVPEDSAHRIDAVPIERRQRAQPSQQLAQTPQPRLAKRSPILSPPSVDRLAADAQPTTSPSQLVRPELASSAVQIAPQRSLSTTVQPTLAPADEPAPGGSSTISEPSLARANVSLVPTIRPLEQVSQLPARIRRPATQLVSPEPVSSPASAQTERSTRNPTAVPARTALTKSDGGTAGLGISPNLDRSEPAPTRPSQVASAATRRAAVQQMPQGPAISPAAPAHLSRSSVNTNRPSASARAQPVQTTAQTGAQQPIPLAANASAAPTKTAASALPSPATASKGETQIELGPTRIASSSGMGRAAGGGQPMLNTETQARQITRSAAGGEPTLGLVAEEVAEVAAAPRGEGGGQLPSLAPDPRSLSSARSGMAGDVAIPTGPMEPSQTGPPTPRGSVRLTGPQTIGRAEVIDATAGLPRVGGGTLSRPRVALSRPVSAGREAEMVSAAGDDQSSGKQSGEPVAAQGTEPTRSAPGIPGEVINRESGAVAGLEPSDAVHMGPPDHSVAARSASPSDADGPIVADMDDRGAPLPRSRRQGRRSALQAEAASVAAAAPPASPRSDPDSSRLTGGIESGPTVRQHEGSLPIYARAPIGLGGLGAEINVEVGLPTRRSQEESQHIERSTARFVRQDVGGPIGLSAAAELATDAFRQRSQRHGDPEGGGEGALSPQTEEAIELGLAFLARHQAPDGRWSLNDLGEQRPGYERESASVQSDSAATALALLSFLGAGYHHKDYKYKDVVALALDYLIKSQRSSGELYVAKDLESDRVAALYSHGIATIALCEAYGMTQDPELRQPGQRALDFIVKSQNAERGGWRYAPGRGSDTSVTGWMMMALKSGELANLQVPHTVYEKIEHWLDEAQASPSERHLYRYNPFAPDTDQQRHGRRPTHSMTAVGLLMRLYSGWRRDDRRMMEGADNLLENLPEMGTARNNKRDTYYWYYATQVMFHMGGQYWEAWNNKLHPLLLDTQVKEGLLAGSWNPRLPVPDRWGPHAGRIYVTTLNLLSMEVYYRHLPIYEETAR